MWDVVKCRPFRERGFDDKDVSVTQFSVPELEANGEPWTLSPPPAESDIAGTFRAIAEVAGYVARSRWVDPADPEQHRLAAGFAEILEDMVRGLRHALEQSNETETP